MFMFDWNVFRLHLEVSFWNFVFSFRRSFKSCVSGLNHLLTIELSSPLFFFSLNNDKYNRILLSFRFSLWLLEVLNFLQRKWMKIK